MHKKNAWIGAQVVVLGGSNIGEGTVGAAGSVVNKTLEPLTLCAGTPAKKVYKFDKILID